MDEITSREHHNQNNEMFMVFTPLVTYSVWTTLALTAAIGGGEQLRAHRCRCDIFVVFLIT
jgi:hypothetical protein